MLAYLYDELQAAYFKIICKNKLLGKSNNVDYNHFRRSSWLLITLFEVFQRVRTVQCF